MTFLDFSRGLSDLPPIILIVGIVFGLYHFKKLNAKHQSLLYYLMAMLSVDVASRIIGLFGSNFIMLFIFSLIEIVFFVYFYNLHLYKKPNSILILLGVAAAIYIIIEIILFYVLNTINIKQFQPYSKVVDNFVIIIMALYFFYQKLNSFTETKWSNFKLNIVLLTVFMFNTIIFLPFNFMINESSGVKYYFWTGNSALVVLLYLYIINLIWRNVKAQTITARK